MSAAKKATPRVEILRMGRGPYYVYIGGKVLADKDGVGRAFKNQRDARKAAESSANPSTSQE